MILRKMKLVVIFLIFFCNFKSLFVVIDDDFGEIYLEGLFKYVDVCYLKLGLIILCKMIYMFIDLELYFKKV